MNNYENKLKKEKEKYLKAKEKSLERLIQKQALQKQTIENREAKRKNKTLINPDVKKITSVEQTPATAATAADESRLLRNGSKKIKKISKSDKINVKKVFTNVKTSKYIRKLQHKGNKELSYHNQTSGISKTGDFTTDICEKISDHIILMSDIHKKAIIKGPLIHVTLYDMFYKIEWKKRSSGYQPVPAFFKGSLIIKFYPHLLLDYIEKQKSFSS